MIIFSLEPICCKSYDIHIDSICLPQTLNRIANQPFDHSIAIDQLYRGIRCWRQFDDNNIIIDFVWQTEICRYRSTRLSSINNECTECDCECGPERCTNGMIPMRIVHKRIDNDECRCLCDCHHYCNNSKS